MTTPTPEQTLRLLAEYIEAEIDEPADMPVGVESAPLEDAWGALMQLDPTQLRAQADALAEGTPLSRILDDCHNCCEIKFIANDRFSDWHAEFEFDRAHFQGTGSTAEAALIEALVDKQIGDYYYAASMEGPALTQEEMTTRLRDAYRKYLGEWPEHEYRGDYVRKGASDGN